MAETKQIPIQDFRMDVMIEFAIQEMQKDIMEVELLETQHMLIATELAKELQKPKKLL